MNWTTDILEEMLSRPDAGTVELMSRLEGDVMVLGAAGKMGPSLARMARRAVEESGKARRVIAVSRFSDPAKRALLEDAEIDTIACDLSDPEAVARLPKAANVIYMAGRKFGESGSEAMTWLMNTVVPGIVARHFVESRIVNFSTGCVYPLMTPESGGSQESQPPEPVGEYANSCLGRERVFEAFSRMNGTPVIHYRLNYAVDLRYGVLVDVARAIWEDRPVGNVPAVNVIWQGDANNRALRCLELAASPPAAINVTGAEQIALVELVDFYTKRFQKDAVYTGKQSSRCYLSDASRSVELFGPTKVDVYTLMEWVAEWIEQGGENLGKPTHFEVTDGKFLD